MESAIVLTDTIPSVDNARNPFEGTLLTMRGRIRTKQKCPCGRKYEQLPTTTYPYIELRCPACPNSRPTRVFIHALQLKCGRIYSDRKGNPFDSFASAHRQLESMRKEYDEGKLDPDNWIPKKVFQYRFENLIKPWQKECEIEVSKDLRANSGYRKTEQRIRDYIIPYFGDMDVRDIKKPIIKRFYIHLIENSDKSDKTIKHILSDLHTFLTAVEDEAGIIVPKFPKIRVIPKREKKTIDEVTQMLVWSCVRDPFKLAIETCIDTGIRTGECRGLKKKDLFHDGYLAIQRAYSECVLREQTKEGYNCYKPKIIPVSPAIYKRLVKRAESLNDDDLMFTYQGRPLSKMRLWHEWKNACIKADVPYVPLTNSTRHSRATNIMKQYMEEGREKARAQIGHTNKATTVNHYIVDDFNA